MTRREAEVLMAVAERLTNAEIAERLFVSERTVESHVRALLRKLDAVNRVELAKLAKQALAERATPALPAALELLADRTGYVGRTEELRRLRGLWDRSSQGQMLVGIVSGEAGIGKSRLVAELAAEVSGAGGRVLLGSCFEDSVVPYQPFVQAIADDAATASDDTLRRRIGADGTALSRLVPDVGQRTGLVDGGDELDPTSARATVAAAVGEYLTRSSTEAPILLVVEDIHWATATTLATVRHLARWSKRAAVLVLVTTRDTAPDLSDELGLFLGDLQRLPTVRSIALSGLPTGDVAQLLAQLGADDDPATVIFETGGNPLLVREVARAAGTIGPLHAMLTRRYALLADTDLELLDAAAVIGSELDADVLASALGLTVVEVLDVLECLGSAGLVDAMPGRPGRFAFVHSLFRRARYDGIATGRRAALHRDVAAALATRVTSNEQVLPELARHARLAAPLGDTKAAIDFSIAAAELAQRSLALDEAADHYRRALDLAQNATALSPRAILTLSIRLGEVLHGVGDPESRPLLLRAAASARAAADADALADIATAMIRYGGLREPGADPEFVSIAEDALEAMGLAPTVTRARTLAALSEDVSYTDPARAMELIREARTIAEQLGDPMTLGHVLLSYRFSGNAPDNADVGHPTADRLIALGEKTGHVPFVLLGMMHRAWTLRMEGALGPADRAMRTAGGLLGDAPAPIYAALVILWRSSQAMLAGDLDRAEHQANEVLALAGRGFDPTLWYGPALMTIRANQDRLAELVPLIEAGVDQPALGETYRAALAVAYSFEGRLEEARRILEHFLEDDLRAIPRNMLWFNVMVCLAETAEVAGDQKAAEVLGAGLEPYAGRIAAIPASVVSTVDLALAQLELAAGDHDRAEAVAARAVAASRRRDTPLFLARELLRLAAARRSLGGTTDAVEALVHEALAIADRTGALLIRRDAERLGLA